MQATRHADDGLAFEFVLKAALLFGCNMVCNRRLKRVVDSKRLSWRTSLCTCSSDTDPLIRHCTPMQSVTFVNSGFGTKSANTGEAAMRYRSH